MCEEVTTLKFKEKFLRHQQDPYTRYYKDKIHNTLNDLTDIYNKIMYEPSKAHDRDVIGNAIDILMLFEHIIEDTVWQKEDVEKLERAYELKE